MQSRAFHGMEVAALCPDTKRAPPPLVRLRKTTRVCLPVSSSSPILTARPFFLAEYFALYPPYFRTKERVRIFFRLVHDVQSPISTLRVPRQRNSPPPRVKFLERG